MTADSSLVTGWGGTLGFFSGLTLEGLMLGGLMLGRLTLEGDEGAVRDPAADADLDSDLEGAGACEIDLNDWGRMEAGLLLELESEGRGASDRGTDDGGLDEGGGGAGGPEDERIWEGEKGRALRDRGESSLGAGRLVADDFDPVGRGSGVSGTGSEASDEDASKLGTRPGARAEVTSRFGSSVVSMAHSPSISAVSASGAMLRGDFSEVGAKEGAAGTLWTRFEVDLGESDVFARF